MGGGNAPTPPNPQNVAQQQSQSNVETGVAGATLGNTNQVTPFGSLNYSETGGRQVGNNWVPSYTATQTLSPQIQGIANSALGGIQGAVGQGLPNVNQLRGDAYKALSARTNEDFDRQTKAQGAQLANQGIAAGSEAYNRAFQPIERARVDASNQNFINAGTVAGQNLQQAQTIHNQPFVDFASLIGASQPNYAPSSAGSITPTDITGPTYAGYQGQLQQYQTNQSANNATTGGIFGLGGSALMAGGLML